MNAASKAATGLNDRISSARAVPAVTGVDDGADSLLPVVARDYRRRDNERLFEANVIAVRAVLEDAGQQCWVEPRQASPERAHVNGQGALLGAVVGGILGHQVGGGESGRAMATGIGAVAVAPGLMGCDLRFPRAGVPGADDSAAGSHRDGQRAGTAARLTRPFRPARARSRRSSPRSA
jgi:Glycine zipper 2TM domain